MSEPLDFDEIHARFAQYDQAHVFAFRDDLSRAERTALDRQAQHIAPLLEELIAARNAALGGSHGPEDLEIAPVDAIPLPRSRSERARHEEARERGDVMIRAGRVAAFVVAGGQGTRLGFPGPKGDFPVGPVSDRTLFRIQAQKIQRLTRSAGRPVPWYVMTSDATDTPTREIFERERNFGIPDEDVRIFPQQMVPAFDLEGRLILETKSRIAESPNGHGGSLTALLDSGALDDMETRGIDRIFYYQVDNPLVKIGDPVYLGLHEAAASEMSCKVVRKTDPYEKVGVVAKLGNRVGIIEYSELKEDQRLARDSEGELIYWAGNIAIHLLNADFVRRVARNASETLPYHLAEKKIPGLDAAGTPVEPQEPNGHKLERFVFDALGAARNVCVVEADGASEFSPIKNASGKDSPEISRGALTALYMQWLREADVEIPPECEVIEIDHSQIDGPEDLRAAKIRCLADAGDAIKVGPGIRS